VETFHKASSAHDKAAQRSSVLDCTCVTLPSKSADAHTVKQPDTMAETASEEPSLFHQGWEKEHNGTSSRDSVALFFLCHEWRKM
jgi:hypothetical protein